MLAAHGRGSHVACMHLQMSLPSMTVSEAVPLLSPALSEEVLSTLGRDEGNHGDGGCHGVMA